MMRLTGHNIRKWLLPLLLLLPSISFAQDIQLSGFLQLDKRFNYGGSTVAIADFCNRFRLQVEASPGEQRLSWGTADKLNPTDNLNPDDFSDLLSPGEKIPTWAVRGSLYLGDFVLTGVWLPSLTPALLPREGESPFLDGGASGLKDSLVLPAQRPENSMFAFKLEGSLGPMDFSLSYFNGFDDIPILRRANLDTGSLELGFPRLQVVGADLATELLGIGFWAEGAMFLAEKVVSQTISGAAS